RLPGPGTVLLGMSAEFVKAGYIGDTVTVEVRIREVQGNRLVLDFTCSNQDQQALVTGDARVSVPRRRPEAGA
ncbi:MAG TPA: hotdog domain-containing protein, partial [Gemmatimonadaceae bacterium]